VTLTVVPDITYWTRMEPRPRVNDFLGSLRAEIRDPMWLLTRQRRVGEFKGEDTGSPAYVRVTHQSAPFRKWGHRTGLQLEEPGVELDFDYGRPLEAQALAEPHTADVTTQVELGQVFFDLLDGQPLSDEARRQIKDRFREPQLADFAALNVEASTPFNPRDRATTQFLLVTQRDAVNGFGIYLKAKEARAPGGVFPPGLAANATERAGIEAAFDRLILWVESTYGSMSYGADPPGWDPRRLEFDLRLRAGDSGEATLTAVPDADGTLTWPSFDFRGQSGDPFTVEERTTTETQIPLHVRFMGMPAPRFWDFEEGDLSLPAVNVDTIELAKLVLIDLAVVAGIDWFTIPLDIPSGTIARVQTVVVRDVFGRDTSVPRAEDPTQPAGPGRWTIFSSAQPGAGLASFQVLPPSAGRTVQAGPVLEEVRLARDEAANLVWAIERLVPNPIGQPRPGNERDAAVDASAPARPPGPPTSAPLRYQITSKVPVNWIPFLGVQPVAGDPRIELEKGAVARPNPDPAATNPVALVRSTARLLDPDKVRAAPAPGDRVYRLPEEEVPRAGLRVQRLVYRARWSDGSTHVWVTRRKLVGAGETQSGLRFDAALPTPR
jgi:hypothetical protein